MNSFLPRLSATGLSHDVQTLRNSPAYFGAYIVSTTSLMLLWCHFTLHFTSRWVWMPFRRFSLECNSTWFSLKTTRDDVICSARRFSAQVNSTLCQRLWRAISAHLFSVTFFFLWGLHMWVNHVLMQVSKSCWTLYIVRLQVPRKILKQVYMALVQPYLNYCISPYYFRKNY